MSKIVSRLDEFRAETMKQYLNEEGQKEIWKYDIVRRKDALKEAFMRSNFDNIQIDSDSDKEFCLIGPGITDHPFNDYNELDNILRWLCCEEGGYLSCYAKAKPDKRVGYPPSNVRVVQVVKADVLEVMRRAGISTEGLE